jgi:hypothetical protein
VDILRVLISDTRCICFGSVCVKLQGTALGSGCDLRVGCAFNGPRGKKTCGPGLCAQFGPASRSVAGSVHLHM